MNDHGYPLLARAALLSGASSKYAERLCALAYVNAAPMSAVQRVGTAWLRDRQIIDPVQRLGLGLAPLPSGAAEPEPEGTQDWRRVRVRWTELCETVIDVPADVAGCRTELLRYLNEDWTWTQGADTDTKVRDAYLSEVEVLKP